MALETQLERIATALETISKVVTATAQGAPLTPPPPAIGGKTKAKEKEKAPEAPPAASADDLLGMGDTKPQVVVTLDDLHKSLQAMMAKETIDPTKKLMIEHGANAAKPTITTIPVEKYGALMDALKAKGY